MAEISDKDALDLLEKRFLKYRKDWRHSILDHVIIVRDLSLFLAGKMIERGENIDLKLLSTACLLHDIGYATAKESVRHGVEGAKYLKEKGLEREARAAERHIGVGISREESIRLGLVSRDLIPKTIEERILCYCDNLDFFDNKTGKHTLKDSKAVEERFGSEMGEEYRRQTEEFNRRIESMTGEKGMEEFKIYVGRYNKKLAAGPKLKL
ncbi:MAG: HD domain-containing protein [Candidatus Aenigmarchaeota archaeon]|nr:HD domain-containing protein [Candidatus Aenigmarchaeota archaeon]